MHQWQHVENIWVVQFLMDLFVSLQLSLLFLIFIFKLKIRIDAVGGRDDATELSTAERYNPKTNQWSPVVAMNSRRSGVGLAVVNNLLMAIGGFDVSSYFLLFIENKEKRTISILKRELHI